MLKVGILGGTFDPIHNGHLAIAEEAMLKIGLDVVFFMPAGKAPLKDHDPLASAVDRYKMVELALKDHPKCDILDWEIANEGISYTIDTARLLNKNWANDRFYWIIGGDLVESLNKWKEVNELVKLIDFIVVERPGYNVNAPRIPNLNLHRITNPLSKVSSTEVRRRIEEGESIDEMVPEIVKNYIIVNELYG